VGSIPTITSIAEWSGDRRWLISISRMVRYHYSVQNDDKGAHYLINYCNSKVGTSLVGVIGAYLCYIQMAVEHNHHEVQREVSASGDVSGL
jgi:hypothetical protein